MHPAGLPFVSAGLAVAALGRRNRWLRRAGLAAAGANAAFFRHPPRTPPSRPGVVVAPADGLVCLVEEAEPPAELGLNTGPLPGSASSCRSWTPMCSAPRSAAMWSP